MQTAASVKKDVNLATFMLTVAFSLALTLFNCIYTYSFSVNKKYRPEQNPKNFKKAICIATGVILFCSFIVFYLAVFSFGEMRAKIRTFDDFARFESCVDSYMQVGEYQLTQNSTNYLYATIQLVAGFLAFGIMSVLLISQLLQKKKW